MDLDGLESDHTQSTRFDGYHVEYFDLVSYLIRK